MKLDTACKVVSLVVGLIAIFNFIKDLIENQALVFSPLTIVFISISLIMFLFIFIIKDKHSLFFRKIKFLLNSASSQYYTKEKDIEYIYSTKSLLQYRKKETIVSLVNGLSSWTGRFRWAKSQNSFNVECTTENHGFTYFKHETWWKYTVNFPSARKKDIRVAEIRVKDLSDVDGEARYLSSTIHEKVEKIKYTVSLCSTIKPKTIDFYVFGIATDFPIYSESYDFSNSSLCKYIKYDSSTNKITLEL